MGVVLNKSWESFVAEQVDSGEFENATEVVQDALRVWRDRRNKLEVLRREVQKGLDDIEAGRVVEPPTIDELIESVRMRKQK
jgi:antitoxin ParD1/3/4